MAQGRPPIAETLCSGHHGLAVADGQDEPARLHIDAVVPVYHLAR